MKTIPDHAAFLFCQQMGWTYAEYMNTPADVLARWVEYSAIAGQILKPKEKYG